MTQDLSNAPVEGDERIAIRVEHLAKDFRIRRQTSLKAALLGAFRGQTIEQFTALRDVSFSVNHGETVAVIGRNGSGKSTLLGLIARIYRPTSGTVQVWGDAGKPPRVAPLLELNAGFVLDLSGEENILFYGAILGLNGKQIEAKRTEIIEFAELENKIKTPMMGWNEGAKLRLGFSIAVHIDPDLLLIDEVLAVGDESFQHKCYRRISELQQMGKTIVFVSHDLAAVERVAGRVIWIDAGVVLMDGPTKVVLEKYRSASE